MPEEKMVEVVALRDGQTPSGDWKYPGETFEVPLSMRSKLWMKRADGKPWSDGPEEKSTDRAELIASEISQAALNDADGGEDDADGDGNPERRKPGRPPKSAS